MTLSWVMSTVNMTMRWWVRAFPTFAISLADGYFEQRSLLAPSYAIASSDGDCENLDPREHWPFFHDQPDMS